MHCAECGTQMQRREDGYGGWVRCCSGLGYWWTQAPTRDDLWLGRPACSHLVVPDRTDRVLTWFYRTAKWPVDMPPVIPTAVCLSLSVP